MCKESTHSILGVTVFRPGVLFNCELKGPSRRGKTKRDKASGAWGRGRENKTACSFQNSGISTCDGCPPHGVGSKRGKR